MSEQYLTVSALTKYLKRKFELDPHLREVWLQAEISNFKLHSRGHMYFTLKDDTSNIQSMMFSPQNKQLAFMPENGMNVLVKGHVSVFERIGQYRFYVNDMQPDGVGSLHVAYKQLEERLTKLGYFRPEIKKQIVQYPTKIGIITSPTGAVIRDILTTIKRRYPFVQTTLFPVNVQGEGAADSISRAIRQANDLNVYDTLIIARGGGSMEDLWSFNEEKVVQAIYESTIPIISAIGHETDITLSDFAADLRAPTPTAAAELAVPSKAEIARRFDGLSKQLSSSFKQYMLRKSEHLQRLQSSYAFRYPEMLIQQKEQELDSVSDRLRHAMKQFIQQNKDDFIEIRSRFQQLNVQHIFEVNELKRSELHNQLQGEIQNILREKTNKLNHLITRLTLLNPLETMKRGFAIPFDPKNEIIHSIKDVQVNDKLTVRMYDGEFYCEVFDKKENDRDE